MFQPRLARLAARTALILAALLLVLPASRANDAMTFTLGRLESAPACGAPCAQFIVARGEITHASAFGFFYARKRAGDRDLPVILESPGGYVIGATFLARKWRELDVTAIIARAEPTCRWGGTGRACDPRDAEGQVQTFRLVRGGSCASACPMLLAGAVRRLAMSDARFGVHRPAINRDSAAGRLALSLGGEDAGAGRRLDRGIPDHFSAMGIDPRLAERYHATPNETMDWFPLEEARALGLVNALPAEVAGHPALPKALLEAIR
ncbi:hypothetical protein [Rhabdaerophilum sp. SD176]|uniref:hypothetical protein n=1 Tax=Rhabdaerophilum sp. SD176 TaxID=2983548 RepID=UPI0024DF837D|nr:hypothetical protein [Rhabdaerophilum sp. SD176]